MPGLLTKIEQAVGSLDIAALAGGTGAQYRQLGQTLAGWNAGPPGDFSAALGKLGGLQMPQLQFAGSLGSTFEAIVPSLQGDLGGLVTSLGSDVTALPERLKSGLLNATRPLVERIEMLRTLLTSDWTCGLVPGFAPAPSPAPTPGPAPAPAPAPPPTSTTDSAITPAKVAAARAVVDTLPADLSVPGLMRWLHARVGTTRPGYFTVRSLPLVDDIRDPLDTLVRWEAASAANVEAELQATLATLAGLVRRHASGLFAAALPAADVAALNGVALGSAAEAFVGALETLADRVQAANAAALPAALAAAQAACAALLTQNAAIAASAATRQALVARLAALPGQLDAGICRLLVLLQPRATLADLTEVVGVLEPPPLPAAAFDPVREAIGGVTQRLELLLDAIDIGAVATPLTQALNSAGDAVQAVEQGLAQLSAQVLATLEQAQGAVQGLSLDALREQAIAGITTASTALDQAVSQALAPAADALQHAMTAVFEAMDTIDPEALAQPVRDAVHSLGDLVQQEAVQRIVEVAGQIEQVAQQIATLSFAPVADEVIALIRQLETLIEGIDIASLPDPGPALVSAAMDILPRSLTPLTDPLIVDLDAQIAGAPTALLEQVKTLPDEVRARLLAFSPRQALQPVLAQPFQAALAELERFSPATWLAAGDAALAQLRRQLAAQLDIARLLAEPARAFATLATELDRLRPSALLAPVEQAIESALAGLSAALPVGDLAAALEGSMRRLAGFTNTLAAALDVATHITSKVAALGDARSEFEAWVDAIVAKVPVAAAGAIATALGELRSAALAGRPAALAQGWQDARAALVARLDAADATDRLTRLASARSRIVAGLGNAAIGAAVPGLAGWLGEAETRAAGDGLNAMAALARALAAADSALQGELAALAERFPNADGALAPLVPGSAATLRADVREAFVRQLGTPLLGLLASLKPMAALVDAGIGGLRDLVEAVDAKLGELLAAPQALADLLADVTGVQQRLAALDLGVYTREVDAVHTAFVDQVRALDPRGLQRPLEAARDQLLARLSLGELLPAPLRGQLASAQRQLVAKIGSLDPDRLLLEPLDAEYREAVEPLVAALDISASVQIIIDWLNRLPEDLRLQIGRIDVPYGELLRLAPGGGSGSSASAGGGVSL